LRRVEWSTRALRSLFDTYDYIAGDDPEAAARVVNQVRRTVALLEAQPMLGRPSRFHGRRELIVDQYVITYRIHTDRIAVVAFEHGARRR
jgi:addiction module RelE/StbE family toxin